MGTKKEGFHQRSKGISFGKFFGIRRCSLDLLRFFYAPRGRNSSYFGLFSILEAVRLSFNAIRDCLAIFSLRGCLAK